MGNEESGMLEEGDEVGSLPARGGRRGAGGRSTGDNSTGGSLNINSDYGDYSASSSSNTRRRGGRRGNASSSNKDSNYSAGVSADKFKTPSSVTTGADDMFADLDLPMGETPKSISNKGRKAFNQAIWSPRGDNSKPPKGFQGNSNSSSLNVVPKQSKTKSTEKKKVQETTEEEPEKPAFNFDSLYFNQSKPSSQKVTKSEVDDDLFSNPFGVSGGSGASKETKSRSINVDVKMGNQKLKDKVRGDRRKKEQRQAKNTFHRPNADVMYDAFDDLEEEMIGEGVIGNGNKKSGDKISKRSSVAKPKELQWNTGREGGSSGGGSGYGTGRGKYDPSSSPSSSRNRGSRDMGGNDDGWF